MPLCTPLRNLPGFLLAQALSVSTFICFLIFAFPADGGHVALVTAEPPDEVEMLVAPQTHGDVMDPWLQPFGVPLAEDGHLVCQTAALEEAVEAAREGISVHIQKVLVVPSILTVDTLDYLEELFLCVAVAGVALADVAKLHVDEVLEGSAVDLTGFVSFLGRVSFRLNEDPSFVGCVEVLDDLLPVLASPPTVAAVAAGRGSSPVETVCLVLPGSVMATVISYFAKPVPRTGIEDVLKARDLRL